MIKIVIDNNIFIDVLKPNPEFEADSKSIFKLIGEQKIKAFVGVNSLTDIFYVLQKSYNEQYAKQKIGEIMTFSKVITLTEEDCAAALALPMSDFEDAIVAVCAKKIGADCIVTRDEKFLSADCEVKRIKPQDFINELDL